VMTGAGLISELLVDLGIKHIFGIPGVYVLPLFVELEKAGIQIILTRHEQGAAFMADGYARKNGLGCCISTAGPGALNLITGIAASYMDSIPVIAITGQAPLAGFGKYAIQEGTGIGRTPDIVKAFEACTKFSKRIMRINDIKNDLETAVHIAKQDRKGPVHLDIPCNLLTEEMEKNSQSLCHMSFPPEPIYEEIGDDCFDRVVEEISKAKSPVFLVGAGATSEKSIGLVIELAKLLNIPIVCTLRAKGFFRSSDPLFCGVVGCLGQHDANKILFTESDLILALGLTFSYLTTQGWAKSIVGKKIIRVDIDKEELTRNCLPIIAVHNKVEAFLEGLLKYTTRKNPVLNGTQRKLMVKTSNECFIQESDRQQMVNPIETMKIIHKYITENTTIVTDIGQNAYWAEQYLETKGFNSYIVSGGLGALGHGVASAIGVCLGSNKERTICITGDGGFMFTGFEVSTAVQYGIPVIWIIFNNQSLGTQKAWLRKHNLPEVACNLPYVDFAGLARALGANGFCVNSFVELERALQIAITEQKPAVLDVIIDPDPAPVFQFSKG
jgi:acetolactate synthase-1/2/3 large subunit